MTYFVSNISNVVTKILPTPPQHEAWQNVYALRASSALQHNFEAFLCLVEKLISFSIVSTLLWCESN